MILRRVNLYKQNGELLLIETFRTETPEQACEKIYQKYLGDVNCFITPNVIHIDTNRYCVSINCCIAIVEDMELLHKTIRDF